jgi:hypothetical protein
LQQGALLDQVNDRQLALDFGDCAGVIHVSPKMR